MLLIQRHSQGYILCCNYLLGDGGYVLGSVGLFVCLSISNITQKIINGLQ